MAKVPPPTNAIIRTGNNGRNTFSFKGDPRQRIGARYDQYGRVINYLPDGSQAPAGVTGVGATRPHQDRDNIGATSTNVADWLKRFPNRPDGSARSTPVNASSTPATASNVFSRPSTPKPGDDAFIGPVQPQTPKAPAVFQRPGTQGSDGETVNIGPNGVSSIEYDPSKDTTRKAVVTTDIADPARTTRTLRIDPRYGGGTATGKVNGGARDSASNQYAENVDAGTLAALNEQGARNDSVDAPPAVTSNMKAAAAQQQGRWNPDTGWQPNDLGPGFNTTPRPVTPVAVAPQPVAPVFQRSAQVGAMTPAAPNLMQRAGQVVGAGLSGIGDGVKAIPNVFDRAGSAIGNAAADFTAGVVGTDPARLKQAPPALLQANADRDEQERKRKLAFGY